MNLPAFYLQAMKPFQNLLLISFSVLLATVASAQPKNYLYVEAGGTGLYSSVSYEHKFGKERQGLSLRAGIGFYTEDAAYLTIPVVLNYWVPLKKDNQYLNFGGGITLASINGENVFRNNEDNLVSWTGLIGYQRYFKNKKNFLRFAFTPVINRYGFVPWVGIGAGLTL